MLPSLDKELLPIIKTLQIRLNAFKSRPEAYGQPKEVAKLVESYEYVLQNLWGFDLDASKHTHWLEIKGCECPKMDNKDSWGMFKIFNSSCPFHGN